MDTPATCYAKCFGKMNILGLYFNTILLLINNTVICLKQNFVKIQTLINVRTTIYMLLTQVELL